MLDTPSKPKPKPLRGRKQHELEEKEEEGEKGAEKLKRRPVGKVTIATVKQAISEATSSPLQQYLKALPLTAKLFLAALLARTRRTGVSECVLGDVVEEAKRLALMAAENPLVGDMLMRADDDHRVEGGNKGKSGGGRVLGMGVAVGELAEAGLVGVEARRGRGGKVRLGVGDEEIRLALRDDGEVKGLRFGG